MRKLTDVERWSALALGVIVLALVALMLFGCGAAQKQEPVCHGVTREQLTARYLAEVAALKASGKCNEYPDPAECPEFQLIQAEQDQRAREWVECHE